MCGVLVLVARFSSHFFFHFLSLSPPLLQPFLLRSSFHFSSSSKATKVCAIRQNIIFLSKSSRYGERARIRIETARESRGAFFFLETRVSFFSHLFFFSPPCCSLFFQVQILVRVVPAEKKKSIKGNHEKEGSSPPPSKATTKRGEQPHFELLEGCTSETTVADLKRQVCSFSFFFLLFPSPSSSSSSFCSTSYFIYKK